MADYIPLEVQAEILKRLPTKSLMQFRSVSKPWKSLIDSPKFIADYSFNHNHQQHLLVSYENVNYQQKNVSFVDDGLETHRYNVIVSFDLKSEGFMEVSLPDTLASVYYGNLVISKLKESLVVVVEVDDEPEIHIYSVWMMEGGVSNSFTKLFSINSPDASIKMVLGFWKSNEPIFSLRTDNNVDDVFVHKLHSEDIKYILLLDH